MRKSGKIERRWVLKDEKDAVYQMWKTRNMTDRKNCGGEKGL